MAALAAPAGIFAFGDLGIAAALRTGHNTTWQDIALVGPADPIVDAIASGATRQKLICHELGKLQRVERSRLG
jgi:hypothetical protein